MHESSGLATWLLLALIIIVWPLFFIILWSAIVLAMSRLGGWSRLARHYRTDVRPGDGRNFDHVTGMVGIARYKGVLRIVAAQSGIYIETRWIFRIGHAPLFIAWQDIRNARKVTLFYREFIAFDVCDPVKGKMRLPSQIFDGSPVFID